MPPGSGRVASQWGGQSGEWSYLDLPLVGLHPPQPDLVLLELAGDVGDDLPHVEPLAGPEVALQLGRLRGLQDQPGYKGEGKTLVVMAEH